MTDRETVKVNTPVNKVVIELKSWLTGGEKMQMLRTETADSIDFMIKFIVVSPDVEAIKNLHGKDFDFLLVEMNKVISDSTWSEKKN